VRPEHLTLNWTQPPTGAAELVLIVQDPDVPIGKPAIHALTAGIDPSLTGIGPGRPLGGVSDGRERTGKAGIQARSTGSDDGNDRDATFSTGRLHQCSTIYWYENWRF
jgi:phosphatidylethanolamine-binding protein (PEBP) family uncharacterized protein